VFCARALVAGKSPKMSHSIAIKFFAALGCAAACALPALQASAAPACAELTAAAALDDPAYAYADGSLLPGISVRAQTLTVYAPQDASTTSIRVGAGDRVAAGTLLLALADPELKQQEQILHTRIDAANADLERWRADLARAQSQDARRRDHPQLFAQEERDSVAAALAAAHAQVRQAQAQVEEAAATLQQLQQRGAALELRAPSAATVSRVLVRAGDRVRRDAPLLLLEAGDGLAVRFAVTPSARPRLAAFRQVCLHAAGRANWVAAPLSELSTQIDVASQTYFALAAWPANDAAGAPGSGEVIDVNIPPAAEARP
jgi:multidrug efflux pump subunit AcrA (membrane-fusion protein)